MIISALLLKTLIVKVLIAIQELNIGITLKIFFKMLFTDEVKKVIKDLKIN